MVLQLLLEMPQLSLLILEEEAEVVAMHPELKELLQTVL
jgi:hypothetical protein